MSGLGHLEQIRAEFWWFPWPWVKNWLRQSVQTHLEELQVPSVQLLASLDRRNVAKTDCWYSEKEGAIDVKTHSEEERGGIKGSWEGPVMGEIVGVVTEPP